MVLLNILLINYNNNLSYLPLSSEPADPLNLLT